MSLDAADSLPAPSGLALGHTIRGGALGWIAFRNSLLTLLTLGVWSFWAKTRIRRYLWANIQIDGDPLHYTGTGFELFKGAFIALLVLMAVFIPVNILGSAGHPWLASGLQLGLILMLTPLGMFFARRYRLSRTEWRGIRAAFSGPLKPFFWQSLGLGLLSIVTLGLTEPYRQVYMERYFWDHSFFGTQRFSSDLTVSTIGKVYYLAWVFFFVPTASLIWSIWTATQGDLGLLTDENQMASLATARNGGALIGFFVGTMLSVIAYLIYRVRLLRAVLSSLRLGGLRVSSEFTVGRAVIIALGAGFMILVPGGMLIIAISMLAKAVSGGVAVLGVILTPFLTLAVGSALWARFWTAPFTSALVTTTHLTGTLELEGIGQSTAPTPGRGEGLLSAVDFGA